MQKSPITIPEDLQQLEEASEQEIQAIQTEMEVFFEFVTRPIKEILNPEI